MNTVFVFNHVNRFNSYSTDWEYFTAIFIHSYQLSLLKAVILKRNTLNSHPVFRLNSFTVSQIKPFTFFD